jgi:hypothetical protein
VTQLVDDQLLGAVLRGSPPPSPDDPLFTTGCFYVRLCQAVLSSDTAVGVLSSPFNALSEELQDRATSALLALPEEIGLVSLRELAPIIGRLRGRHALNILGMEVLAAAVYLEADVYLSAPSPRIVDALRREGRGVEIIAEVTRRPGKSK